MAVQTLNKRKNQLASSKVQLEFLSKEVEGVQSFDKKLREVGQPFLFPKELEILQINLGYMCNMTCEHCHVDAGPDRKEIMSRSILENCLKVIDEANVTTVDLTGGAPEMNPHFKWFVETLSKRKVRVIVRSNLTILESNEKYKVYPDFFKENKVVVIASLPCYTAGNTDKQRGDGTFDKSISALKKLNSLGYGKENSGLELDLVFNPGGIGLPPDQASLELDYKRELKENFDIEFSSLFTITNLPISRFLDYLMVTGKYEEYIKKLSDGFNPHSLDKLMCKNTLSINWNGDLFDCDFNQMLNLGIESSIGNIKDFDLEVISKRRIAVNNHCFGCTAGTGSSCQGALV